MNGRAEPLSKAQFAGYMNIGRGKTGIQKRELTTPRIQFCTVTKNIIRRNNISLRPVTH
ncbi:hypothetical protein SIID45300_03271 [Candidatus Magnetaquicoccaceae bacterium FCR-1]|uniref:Transposase n=1 Tax=Candidatus Magnetaquiglobus chichijimensis TaxID=3141448 RepID=A0ABQ0CDF1_9PROT